MDPVGRMKKFFNDIRDRWHWLDKDFSKIQVHFVIKNISKYLNTGGWVSGHFATDI